MKSFKEVVRFIKFAAVNKESFQIDDIDKLLLVLAMSFKNKDMKEMFIRFLMNSVKEKTLLYRKVRRAFRNELERPREKYHFVGLYGTKGNGEEEFERIKSIIYRYGQFESVLIQREDDMWL